MLAGRCAAAGCVRGQSVQEKAGATGPDCTSGCGLGQAGSGRVIQYSGMKRNISRAAEAQTCVTCVVDTFPCPTGTCSSAPTALPVVLRSPACQRKPQHTISNGPPGSLATAACWYPPCTADGMRHASSRRWHSARHTGNVQHPLMCSRKRFRDVSGTIPAIQQKQDLLIGEVILIRRVTL